MDPKVLAAIVGMLLCLSSSVSSAMSTGGNGDDDSSGAGAGEAESYVEGDIIKLTHNRPIMLAEALIYDNNNKLISHDGSANVTSSPTEPNWGGVDRLTNWDMMNPFHSLNSSNDTYVQFKFSSVKKIKRIQVLARTDARTAEISGLNIEVLNGTTSVAKNTVSWSDGSSHLVEYDPKNNAFVTSNTDGTPIKATMVRLLNFGSDNLIVSEMQIFDKAGTNIALAGTARLSSTHHPDWAAKHANDGNLTNTAHSKAGAGGGQHLDIDLGGEKEVASVVIINRVSDVPSRVQMHLSVVQFFNGDNVVLSTPPIPDGNKAKYEYKVGEHLNRWTMT